MALLSVAMALSPKKLLTATLLMTMAIVSADAQTSSDLMVDNSKFLNTVPERSPRQLQTLRQDVVVKDAIKGTTTPYDVSALDLSDCGFSSLTGMIIFYCLRDGKTPFYVTQNADSGKEFMKFEMSPETFDTSKPAAINS